VPRRFARRRLSERFQRACRIICTRASKEVLDSPLQHTGVVFIEQACEMGMCGLSVD
jgi:hypothetical protein